MLVSIELRGLNDHFPMGSEGLRGGVERQHREQARGEGGKKEEHWGRGEADGRRGGLIFNWAGEVGWS